MPLPRFLALLALVIVAAGATLWLAAASGIPMAAVALLALIAAGVVRLLARVE